MKIVDRIIKGVGVVSGVMGVIATFAILLIMVAITTEVATREGIGSTLPGLFEGTELLLVIAIFLGLAIEQRDHGHIRVTILTEKLKGRARLTLQIIALIIATIMALWLTIESGQRAIQSYQTSEVRWGTMQFLIWPIRACIAIGFGWYFVQTLVSIIQKLREMKTPMEQVTS